MLTRKIVLGLTVCLLIGIFGQKLLSQGMGGSKAGAMSGAKRSHRMSPQERIERFQKMGEDQRKWIEEQQTRAMQQALGVDEHQWKIIEPKLKKVQACRDQAFVGTKPPFQSSFTSSGPGGFAGGFQFQFGASTSGMGMQNSSAWTDPDRPLTDGEAILQELQMLVQDPQTRPEDITQGLNALRQARARGRQKWDRAQQELRKILNLRQQATLTMMGLLE
ncbi:hypothetical protein ACFL5Z_17320 [Planctomycetota bacterium]